MFFKFKHEYAYMWGQSPLCTSRHSNLFKVQDCLPLISECLTWTHRSKMSPQIIQIWMENGYKDMIPASDMISKVFMQTTVTLNTIAYFIQQDKLLEYHFVRTFPGCLSLPQSQMLFTLSRTPYSSQYLSNSFMSSRPSIEDFCLHKNSSFNSWSTSSGPPEKSKQRGIYLTSNYHKR